MVKDPLFKEGLARAASHPQLLRDYDDVLMMVSRASGPIQKEFQNKMKKLSNLEQGYKLGRNSKLEQGSNLDSWIQKLAAKMRKIAEEKKCGMGKGQR